MIQLYNGILFSCKKEYDICYGETLTKKKTKMQTVSTCTFYLMSVCGNTYLYMSYISVYVFVSIQVITHTYIYFETEG